MEAKITCTTILPLTGERFERTSRVVPEEELRAVIDDIIRVTCCGYYDTVPSDDRAVVDIRIEYL